MFSMTQPETFIQLFDVSITTSMTTVKTGVDIVNSAATPPGLPPTLKPPRLHGRQRGHASAMKIADNDDNGSVSTYTSTTVEYVVATAMETTITATRITPAPALIRTRKQDKHQYVRQFFHVILSLAQKSFSNPVSLNRFQWNS